MKRFMFALMLLLIALSSLFAQEKTLRRYELLGHSPKEGIYKRFFGGYSYEKKPIQELRIKKSENSDDIWVMADFGGAKFDKYAEEKVEKTPMTNGKKSTIYTYSFPGTPITMSIIEVYTIATKNTECMICFKSYNEVIYFAKAKRIPMTKEQIAKEKKEAEEVKKRLEEQKKQEEARRLKEQIEQEKKEARIKKVNESIIKSISSIDSLAKVYVINALLEDAFEDFIAGTKKQCYHPEVLLSIDSIKGVQLVTVEVDYKNKVINKDLFDIISIDKQKYLRFKDHDYYLAGNKIFTNINSNIDVTIILAEAEVKNKKGKLKFDKRYGEIPSEIKEWCSKNLMENGSFMVQYAKCDTYYKAIKTKIK